MTNPKVVGALIGLVIGLVVLWGGWLEAFYLVLFILAGYLIAKFWIGEIDIAEMYDRFMRSRGKR